MMQGRKGKQGLTAGLWWLLLKINDKSDATTYEGGGGDDSRRCDFKAAGLELAGRAAVPMPEAN